MYHHAARYEKIENENEMPFQINVDYLKGHALQYHIIQKGNLKGH